MNLHHSFHKNHRLAPLKWKKSSPSVSDSVIEEFYPVSQEVSSKVKCRYCEGYCTKNGKEKNGQQRYRCKACGKGQQVNYRYNAYNPSLNKNIIALTKEGVGIRATARLLGISTTTLIARIKKIASQIKEPSLVQGKTYEVDELRTFIKKKDV